MQLLAKFKKILYMRFRATLNFQKFKVALNPMYNNINIGSALYIVFLLVGGPTLEKLAKNLPDQAVLHMRNLMTRKKNWMLVKEDVKKWRRIR